MATQNVCYHNKFGYCKYQDTCRNPHVKDLCENSQCDISNCSKRHPRMCKFYKEFGKCKFSDYCFFKHVRNDSENEITMKRIS